MNTWTSASQIGLQRPYEIAEGIPNTFQLVAWIRVIIKHITKNTEIG